MASGTVEVVKEYICSIFQSVGKYKTQLVREDERRSLLQLYAVDAVVVRHGCGAPWFNGANGAPWTRWRCGWMCMPWAPWSNSWSHAHEHARAASVDSAVKCGTAVDERHGLAPLLRIDLAILTSQPRYTASYLPSHNVLAMICIGVDKHGLVVLIYRTSCCSN